ncbi:MAG: glycosyltransferase, partial [Anaerolineae bacterium]|nr:glycosyltransferase [Anaerolineae bacterium]
HKNLALTAALSRLRHPRLIAWCHDLAWTNPLYRAELHAAYPWTLLREAWPNTRYVTISEARQAELAELLHLPAEEISVIPPGIDAARFLQWTKTTRDLEDKLHLLDADIILLLPARLTRRKNIGLALHVLAALRNIDSQDYRLIVTGPPGPHNPTNLGYLGELLELRQKLGLVEAAHFLYEMDTPQLIPDDLTMANLYQLADALLFPSLQEGFGIPLLEAGLVGLPVFCSALPPFQQIGQSDVMRFQAEHDPPEQIAQLIQSYFADNPRQRLKNRVRHQYRWDTIIASQIIPLLEG